MFLHIHYGPYDKKNRVTPIENVNISIQDSKPCDKMRIIFDEEKLSFKMRVLKINFITNDNNGKMHLSVGGWDRKNRKVKVYTDNNNKKFVRESDVDPDLFIKADMAGAFEELKEI